MSAADADRVPSRRELEADLDAARDDYLAAEIAYMAAVDQCAFAADRLAAAVNQFALARHRYFEDRQWAT
ncbi:MAG TPA: hypothetical protein VIX41_08925 [Acidimicrobiales bacterium]